MQPSPPSISRVSFSITEALSAALDDIERCGVLAGIPHPMKPTLRQVFEEGIYALAEHALHTEGVPRTFRFAVVAADPRGPTAEQEMIAINEILARAKRNAESDSV